jgi:hypothetical protein
MKLIRYMPTLLIIFSLLTMVAAADSNRKERVTFSDHVMVSGTQLEPGEYVVQWNGSGPGVQIKFLHDGKEVISVTGNVVEQKNPHDSFTTDRGENDSRVLTEIDFSDVTLVLTSSSQ